MRAWPWHVRLRMPTEMCAISMRLPEHRALIRLPERCAADRLLVNIHKCCAHASWVLPEGRQWQTLGRAQP